MKSVTKYINVNIANINSSIIIIIIIWHFLR